MSPLRDSGLNFTDRLLSTAEAGEYFGVSKQTIRKWIKDGIIVGIRVGDQGRWKIRRSEVERLVREKYGD